MSTSRPRATARRIRGLYALVDDDPRWGRDPVAQARAALGGGASLLQLRAKRATDAQAFEWAREIRKLAFAHKALFVINDRYDLALAVGADGVHLGQRDLPPARLPVRARRCLLVGRSTHSVEQVLASLEEPIDYLAFGPVFATSSKEFPGEPRGVALLAEAGRLVSPRPLVAIGGIACDSVPQVMRAGAQSVAVLSAIAGAADPEEAARELAERIAKEARA